MAKKPKVAIVYRDPGGPMINLFALLLGVILLFLIGCSSQAPDPGTSPQLSHKTSMPITLRIILKWSGDDFASKCFAPVGKGVFRRIIRQKTRREHHEQTP